MKLSIIIPVYNIGQYLVRCIESCELQLKDPCNLEILVIDDGSTDNSVEIIKTLQSRYNNIRYFWQENAGQASARNKGISLAKGDYIWFVDGDDFLTPDGIDALLDEAINLHLDVHAFNLQFVNENQVMFSYHISAPANKCFYEQGQDFVCNVEMPHSPCVGLFRREFLIDNALKFKTGIFYEDFELMPRLYCMATKCQFTNEGHYIYFQRSGSTMKLTNKERNNKRCRDFLTIADSLHAFTIEHLKKDTPAYNAMLRKVYFSVTQSLAFYSKEAMPLSEYRSRSYFPMNTSILSGFMKQKAMLANMSLSMYLLIYKIIK